MPSAAQVGGKRYNDMSLCDSSDAMHANCRDNAMAKAMECMYTVLLEVVMRPSRTHDKLARGEVEAASATRLEGHIAVAILVPYPPGTPLAAPDERFTEAIRSILDYPGFAQTLKHALLGFGFDVYDLRHQDEPSGHCYVVGYTKK